MEGKRGRGEGGRERKQEGGNETTGWRRESEREGKRERWNQKDGEMERREGRETRQRVRDSGLSGIGRGNNLQ